MSKRKKQKNKNLPPSTGRPSPLPIENPKSDNPNKTKTDSEKKDNHFNWVKNHKITTFLSTSFVFSLGGIMNYFGNNPRILYLPSIIACLLLSWVLMSTTHKYISHKLEIDLLSQSVTFHDLKNEISPLTKKIDSLSEQVSNVVDIARENFKDFNNDIIKSYAGLSLNLLLRLNEPIKGRDNFIFDIGNSSESNRISVFLNIKRELCFRVIDSESRPTLIKVAPKLDTFEFNNLIYLSFEFGSDNNFSFLRILINGKQVAQYKQDAPMSVPLLSATIGADLNGQNGGVFDSKETMVFTRSLTPREQKLLLDYLEQPSRLYSPAFICFEGNQWMKTRDDLGKRN